jgi:internalin A
MAKRATKANSNAGVRQRIAMYNAQPGQGWPLALDTLNLTEIPELVLDLPDVVGIDLRGNRLHGLPEWLRKLPKLEWLNLVDNPIESLPSDLRLVIDVGTYRRCFDRLPVKDLEVVVAGDSSEEDKSFFMRQMSAANGLKALTLGDWSLHIGSTHDKPSPALGEILASLHHLSSLERLSLRGIRLQTVPDAVRTMKGLRWLDLSGIGIRELPAWIGSLELFTLLLCDNGIRELTDSLSQLRRLEYLDLSHNPLRSIPESVFLMESLTHLQLRSCQIQEIPKEILRLSRLEYLGVDNNPIETPPKEVTTKGLESVRDFWRQREEAGVDYLCEAKLIILGEPGAGKSSLAKKIQHADYELSQGEKSTEGIDIVRYVFPTAIRLQDGNREKLVKRDFQVNIWDFGGQEIYHATHQFFLTRRSVYVLVCDDRKEDTDFSYWLQAVETLGDASPLLIVQNEKQDRTRDINLGALRQQFSNLKVALPTNLSTNRGLAEVVQTIRRELENLPHVGTALPATWKRVREALERDQRDHISLDEYLAVCQQHGFTRRADKLQLSGYLHDLGICLHFQDDPLLKGIVVLKPAWGTDAVYRVLDDDEVIKARGRFSRQHLTRIWSEPKYEGMHDELLQLMMKFQLCYALDGGKTFIAPQLLSSDQPKYEWNGNGNLVMRYEYEFMPKGILTRFVVAMHHLIADGSLVWKTGVVVERDGSRAEVIEEYAQRRLRVRISGSDPRWLLAIVDEQLERLNAVFTRLQYDRYLPCPCSDCSGTPNPYGFSLAKLKRLAGKGLPIQCHESGEMVDAAKLVRDLLPHSARAALQVSDAVTEAQSLKTSPPKPAAEVFVSYASGPASSALVTKVDEALAQSGIRLFRDQKDVQYKDSIGEFMRRIGQGKCVVVVISKKYLKSRYCMFEMLEILKAQGMRERIFPIVLPDAMLYEPTACIEYIRFWEQKMQALEDALKTVKGTHLTKTQQTLNEYADFRRLLDSIADTLRDMNALTPERHEASGFDELIRRVREQLSA